MKKNQAHFFQKGQKNQQVSLPICRDYIPDKSQTEKMDQTFF
jgi:hypothetical protein